MLSGDVVGLHYLYRHCTGQNGLAAVKNEPYTVKTNRRACRRCPVAMSFLVFCGSYSANSNPNKAEQQSAGFLQSMQYNRFHLLIENATNPAHLLELSRSG